MKNRITKRILPALLSAEILAVCSMPSAAAVGLSGSGTAAAVGFSELTQVPGTEAFLEIPDGTYMATEENGDTYFRSYRYGDSIPYVMFHVQEMDGDTYYRSLDWSLRNNHADLKVTEAPHEVSVGNRRMVQFGYSYGLSGYTVSDTRLYTEIGGKTYAFASKEIPEIEYVLGDMLFEVAGSLEVEGEEKNAVLSGGGIDTLVLPAQGRETVQPAGSTPLPETVYRITPMVDADTGLTMARCYAPENYEVSHELNIINVGVNTPVQMQITAHAPGELFPALIYHSAHSYVDNETIMNGQSFREPEGSLNASAVTFNYTVRDASGYCDMLLDMIMDGDFNTKVVSVTGPDAEQAKILKEKEKEEKKKFEALMKATIPGTYTTGTDYSYKLDYVEKIYSLMLPEGENGAPEEYYFIADVLLAVAESEIDSAFMGNKVESYYRSWGPKNIWVMICTRESFEENLEMFRNFEANTRVSDEFGLWIESMGLELVRALQIIEEGGYVDLDEIYDRSSREHLTDSSYSVPDAWSDYVYDQNDYITSNGDHVKMGTEYDHVYEDSNGNVFGTNSAEIPAGMRELTPTQIGR